MKTYILDEVYGMTIKVNGKSGKIVKGLRDSYGDALCAGDKEAANLNGAIDALESLILAHACAGIDIAAKEYQTGIVTALDAIDNNP